MRPALDWYFDFISPFAWLQSRRLPELARHAEVRCVPILFAGLLQHWEHKGPAEIEPKRLWTFEHVAWLAHRDGAPLRLPPMHPFVPLRLLRLSLALGPSAEVVRRLFAFVWEEGQLPADDAAFGRLLDELGVDPAAIDAPEVKSALRVNTEEAIARGLFGVPTCVIGEERYWGYDATDMVLARLRGDPFFESPLLAAARTLPEGVSRPRR